MNFRCKEAAKMADDMVEAKSIAQFNYCSLCKRSHKKRKKHIYSQQHQETVKNILAKFKKKILVASERLSTVEVEPLYSSDGSLHAESGAKFWCYFCQADLEKHEVRVDCLVRFAGFLQHIGSGNHGANAAKFLSENFVDRKRLKELILTEEKLEKFLEKVDTSVNQFRAEKRTGLMKEAAWIRLKERKQQLLLSRQAQQQQQQASSFPKPDLTAYPSRTGQHRAVARGRGLTTVDLSKLSVEGKKEGNVHTGALPPWLQDDDADSAKPGAQIGPTLEDYNRHLERLKKGKLPPGRVGADFNRRGPISKNWMPNFGGVWNKGRRSNTRGDKFPVGKTSSDGRQRKAPFSKTPFSKAPFSKTPFSKAPFSVPDVQSAETELPRVIAPYKRKRSSSTVTSCTVTSSTVTSSTVTSSSCHAASSSFDSAPEQLPQPFYPDQSSGVFPPWEKQLYSSQLSGNSAGEQAAELESWSFPRSHQVPGQRSGFSVPQATPSSVMGVPDSVVPYKRRRRSDVTASMESSAGRTSWTGRAATPSRSRRLEADSSDCSEVVGPGSVSGAGGSTWDATWTNPYSLETPMAGRFLPNQWKQADWREGDVFAQRNVDPCQRPFIPRNSMGV